MGVCVPNFRSVSFFVWPGNVTQINTQIHIYILVKLGISLTGCSPYVDFEIRKYFISRKSSKTVRIFHLKFCRYHKILIPRFSILAPYMSPTLVHGLFEKNIPNILFFKIHVRGAAGRGLCGG